MAICPFLEECMWSGNKCQASGNGNGAPVQDRYFNYCGTKMFSDDYHDCPLYKDATGKRDSGGCYLTSACMSVKGDGFQDNCYELELLRDFRDTYVKENYPEDIAVYYDIAPRIVKNVESLENGKSIFEKMYDELVAPCCDLIENSKLYEAYVKYKDYSMELAHKYLQ